MGPETQRGIGDEEEFFAVREHVETFVHFRRIVSLKGMKRGNNGIRRLRLPPAKDGRARM